MITVEKIGGTSMSQFGEVLENIMLRDPKIVYGRVYVVSAYSGVTNELLEHKKTGAPGIYARFAQGDNYAAAMDALVAKLAGINRALQPLGLDLALADGSLEKRMREHVAHRVEVRLQLAHALLEEAVGEREVEPERLERPVDARELKAYLDSMRHVLASGYL